MNLLAAYGSAAAWTTTAAMSTLAIVLCILGFILLIAEIFMPGFGICGGLGFVSLVCAILLTAKSFAEGMVMFVILLILCGIVLWLVLRSASHGRLSRKIILHDSIQQDAGDGNAETLLGKTGTTATVLRPSGVALIEGMRVDVVTEGEFMPEGVAVKVVLTEGSRVVVRAIN